MKSLHLRGAFSKALIAGCLSAGATGCVSLEQIAPPVGALASSHSVQVAVGRDLYITKCAKCHAPEPVIRYSAERWKEIIPDMAEETKLTAEETAAVGAYVMAVLRAQSAPTN